jgi:signal transduction histidine kinase/streptogramin lyase
VAHDGSVWAGTYGDGLYCVRNGRGIHYTTSDGLVDNMVRAVCVDADDAVWASCSAGTLHRFNQNGSTRFDLAEGLPGSPVTAMIPASRGGLWLGTENGQILSEDRGKFHNVEAAGSFGHRPVLSLLEGEQGRLWIGTAGNGLTCFARGVALNWTTNSGLPDDVIAGIVEDGARNLWLATGAGIYRVISTDVHKAITNPQGALSCRLASRAKSMPDSATVFGGNRALLSPNGYLWFATSEGVLNLDAFQSEIEPASFPVYVESAAINGQPPVSLLHGGGWTPPTTNAAPLAAPVALRSLDIHFTALSFVAPEEIQFRYKLEGYDLDWVNDVVGKRFASYPHLTHGQYRFRVAARLADGPWREADNAFAFRVPTPIYFQTWSICLYVVAAIVSVAGVVRVISHRRLRNKLVRLQQQQSLERERMRIARDMHDEMGSKLTKISFLSEHVQMDAQSNGPFADKIQSIAQTSRDLLKTMDEIVWVVNPRNDTLENLVAYLSHYAVEYFQNTAIECQMRLPQDFPNCPLSSEVRHNLFLTFEEALNNVLKHSGAAQAKVEMKVTALDFELEITDNGRGFEAPDPPEANSRSAGGRGGNGLRNMRQRLAAVGGRCAISSRPGVGTTVSINIGLGERTDIST